MKLGAKIRLLRTLKGYSQEAMAESLKISVTGYGKIERDKTNVTVLRVSQIATVLGIDVEDILRFERNDAFHKRSGSGLHPVGSTQPTAYYNAEETISAFRTMLENRMNRLEDEIQELRKIIFEKIKPID